ncbi:hypothetical protein [Fredinandcohnia sp. 179-A 10B2 NHS]|uniref:hypothetical protein n=1 Tax=Fredinandcohnia sp. 179-A 10B2 NHS TaxID=3235176 RepID=UPI0039A19E2C
MGNDYLKTLLFDKFHFLKVPELSLPLNVVEEYNEIFYESIIHGKGGLVPYKSTYPKYMFLHYLIENKEILVHGTNNPAIDSFEPREQTLFNGKKVKAVFASTDAIWSMFFAVINRQEYNGSLRNICLTTKTKRGIRRYYYFSLNADFKGERWTNGYIYLMPKQPFKQGGIKDEWICEDNVKPLAKIAVSPEDFIFSKDVRSHKESDPHLKTMIRYLIWGR